MRRKTPPAAGSTKQPDSGPQMEARIAARYAGKYAACLKFASGRMMRIGPVYERPEEATEEIRSGKHNHVRLMNGQQIVVGICNRLECRWQEPELLAERITLQPEPEQPTQPTDPDPASYRQRRPRRRKDP